MDIGKHIKKLSLNRTIVGWKHRSLTFTWEVDVEVLIEPLWDGNYFRRFQKLVRLIVLIEPLWDGNMANRIAGELGKKVLIEPLWDGNMSAREAQGLLKNVLIEPLWDGNNKIASHSIFLICLS
ncbi:hypothetical protein JDF658_01130 [Carboxydocella sp. JDF658]|nr:hypothetical protein JDF658_01130 [Carboxydocella sp. JDF658]